MVKKEQMRKISFCGIAFVIIYSTIFCSIAVADDNEFSKFAVFELDNEPNATTLRQFCDTANIPAFHTENYFKKANKESEGQEVKKRALAILNGLSKISKQAMNEKFTFQESVDVLKQLIRLEKKLLNNKPVGAVNIELHNITSMITSAMIFQVAARCDESQLQLLNQFNKSRYIGDQISITEIKSIITGELNVTFQKKHLINSDVLVEMTERKYPSLIKQFNDKTGKAGIKAGDIPILELLHMHKQPQLVRRNFLDVNDGLHFASSYIVAHKMTIYARMGIYLRILRESEVSKGKRKEEIKDFIKKQITAYELELLSDSQDQEKIARDIVGDVNMYLNDKGVSILEHSYKRCLRLLEINQKTKE